MRIIYVLLLFSFCTLQMFSAIPVVEVQNPDSKQILELYEDSEELFAMKVIDYYKTALMLETQLKVLGIDTKAKAIQPTMEELEELDYKVIVKYYKIAKALEDEVIAAPMSDREKLLKHINHLEISTNDSLANMVLSKGEELNSILEKSLERLKSMDKMYSKNLELIRDSYENNCMNSYSLISISGKANTFIANGGDYMKNDPWLSVKGTLNAGRISGFWKDFNVWYEYLSPNFITEYDKNQEDRVYWNTNAHAVGIGGKIPMMASQNFKHGINLELGYFWLKSHITNLTNSSSNWDGMNLNFEYYAGVPSCRYPFELFVSFSIYHNFSKNLRFYTDRPNYPVIDINKTHMAISLGIRYNLLVSDLD
ncbi:MAG TPA: hypothetical protein PLE30_08685 [Candidatus Kapabacteria bacterium]|nr:hypothetical protein [Candidatus Kapabacteria bacterium]